MSDTAVGGAPSAQPLAQDRVRAPPIVIAWLQRALQHEFAAARQFALQAAVARRCSAHALARFSAAAAHEEIEHAQRLAAALVELNASFGTAAGSNYAIGATAAQIIAAAIATERAAIELYERALRACGADTALRALLHGLHAEECEHLARLQRWQTDDAAVQPAAERRK